MNNLIAQLKLSEEFDSKIDKTLLIDSLEELDGLIGMSDVKERVIEMVCENIIDPFKTDIGNHCMITGPPGVGKTTFIGILAKIMFALGITTSLTRNGTPTTSLSSVEKSIIHRTAGIKFVEDQVDYILEELGSSVNEGPNNNPNMVTRLKWIKEISLDLFEDGKPFLFTLNKGTSKRDNVAPLIVRCTRSEVIGQFQGHSANNMRLLYEKARGGILVVDEAYALMNSSRDGSEDNFGKEAIDTLNQLMSEYPDTVVILGGYEDEIRNRLFVAQKGLESRIQYTFDITPPNTQELAIMLKRRLGDRCVVKLSKLVNLLDQVTVDGYGRGIAKLAKQASLVSAKRRFFNQGDPHITIDDLMEGLGRCKFIEPTHSDSVRSMFI